MGLKAVAFDIDGTLYPNYKMQFRSFFYFIKHPVLIKHFGAVRKQLRTYKQIDHFHDLQTSLLAESMKCSVDKAEKLITGIMYQGWEPMFRTIPPYPGMKDSLLALKDLGLKLAAMSDFPIGRKLEYLGLDSLWDLTFSSEESGYLKPALHPFQKISRDLNLNPNEILYVGNSYKYDIIGAKNAGMMAAHIASKAHSDSLADLTFQDYGTLVSWVRDLLKA